MTVLLLLNWDQAASAQNMANTMLSMRIPFMVSLCISKLADQYSMCSVAAIYTPSGYARKMPGEAVANR
jgi:hypothetical protein